MCKHYPRTVKEVLRNRQMAGTDIVADGECSKSNWATYVQDRISVEVDVLTTMRATKAADGRVSYLGLNSSRWTVGRARMLSRPSEVKG